MGATGFLGPGCHAGAWAEPGAGARTRFAAVHALLCPACACILPLTPRIAVRSPSPPCACVLPSVQRQCSLHAGGLNRRTAGTQRGEGARACAHRPHGLPGSARRPSQTPAIPPPPARCPFHSAWPPLVRPLTPQGGRLRIVLCCQFILNPCCLDWQRLRLTVRLLLGWGFVWSFGGTHTTHAHPASFPPPSCHGTRGAARPTRPEPSRSPGP